MLDIGWTELLVIGLVLVVIVGPKDLPRVLRTIGQWTRRVKKIARDFQDNIEDIARDSEIEEMRNKSDGIEYTISINSGESLVIVQAISNENDIIKDGTNINIIRSNNGYVRVATSK